MHSHTISEQQLLAAPMVTREKEAGDVQDVIVMLHDFASRSPRNPGGTRRHERALHARRAWVNASSAWHATDAPHGARRTHDELTHANDVRYDAYLANDHTLDDPEIVRSVAVCACASSMAARRRRSFYRRRASYPLHRCRRLSV
jgi:hypothetical protein